MHVPLALLLEHAVSLCCTHIPHFVCSHCSDNLPDTHTTAKGFPRVSGVRFGLPAFPPAPQRLKEALAASVAGRQGPFQQGPSGRHLPRLPWTARPPAEAGARCRGARPRRGCPHRPRQGRAGGRPRAGERPPRLRLRLLQAVPTPAGALWGSPSAAWRVMLLPAALPAWNGRAQALGASRCC